VLGVLMVALPSSSPVLTSWKGWVFIHELLVYPSSVAVKGQWTNRSIHQLFQGMS
jgi:hypothetical protein